MRMENQAEKNVEHEGPLGRLGRFQPGRSSAVSLPCLRVERSK